MNLQHIIPSIVVLYILWLLYKPYWEDRAARRRKPVDKQPRVPDNWRGSKINKK